MDSSTPEGAATEKELAATQIDAQPATQPYPISSDLLQGEIEGGKGWVVS